MIYSKKGYYVIFDITEFLPGRTIPKSFLEFNKPFFFQPIYWKEENDWGGSVLSRYSNFPTIYSPGYDTAEEALAEANAWEETNGDPEEARKKLFQENTMHYEGELEISLCLQALANS